MPAPALAASKSPLILAWEGYQDLVIEAIDKPALFKDASHQRRMRAAHGRFRELFEASS